MLKRKAAVLIKKWNDLKDKKCLVVQGARQTGKTYIIERYAEENYEEYVEINFKQTPSAAEIFSGDLTVDNMIMAMRFRFPEKKIQPGKTLIFLDEIQECQEAITSLKFWAIDNRYDVIVSGSLLGIDYKRASSYPVGYVDYIKMNGLDFEEFLWGMGIAEDMIHRIREFLNEKKPVPEFINRQMMSYYRQYVAIGGMPEAVQRYVNTRDFREVDTIQRNLLQGYQYDIAHYATAEEKVKAEKCYLTLARQLLDKENHKFQYREIERGARAQKYYSSIAWLLRADMVHLSRLYKKGYSLYFYKNESSKKEIDILIQKDGYVVPVEVKSGNARATSLISLIKKNKDIEYGYKFIDGNIGISDDGIITLPLYMAAFI